MKHYTHLIAAVLSVLSAAGANADMPQIQAPVLSAPTVSMPKVDPPQLSAGTGGKSKSGAVLRAGTGTAAKAVSGKLTAQALLGIAGGGQSDLLAAILSGSAAEYGTAGLSETDGTLQMLSNTGLLSAKNTNASAADTVLLLRILEKLDSLDGGGSVRRGTPASSAESDAADIGGTSGKNAARGNTAAQSQRDAVIRFRVDGCDILPSCKTIYCSPADKSGAFLLTGDREYRADGKRCAETFYFLFRGGTVSAAVMQGHENPDSFLYRIARRSPLPSETIGTIVSVLYSADKNGTEQTPLRLELLVNPPRE
ncbi:MAG: hypothetical protein NC041_07650 [Bacteroides sp.]|nr:hypothetical protein [Prevotella sp.]MCM1407174.1 hypothetical protein [Treponema brennaborense]MCM1470326.1 hypothetical protein [Bacteroides sp.]